MKTMNNLDTTRLAISRSFMNEAFNHARGVTDPADGMASRLLRDINLIDGILTVSEIDDPTGNQRKSVIELMEWPSVKRIDDRVNHLTSPELYTRLQLLDPHMAEAYMKLKESIGQLKLAIYPPKGAYEEALGLANGPVMG